MVMFAKPHLTRYTVAMAPVAAMAAVVLALCLFPGGALAQDVAPADTDATQTFITLGPSDDAYIDSAKPASNAGSAVSLRVSAQALTANVETTLLRFDLTAFPEGTTINKATLRLFQTPATGGAPDWRLPVSILLPGRAESSVTYQTQPPVTASGIVVLSPATTGVSVDTDVTALVDAWINTPFDSPNYGIAVTGPVGSGASRTFSSKEGVRAPQLIIDYTLPPLRICREQTDTCPPAAGALVTINGGAIPRIADGAGLVDTAGLALGQSVWARLEVSRTNGGALFDTLPVAVTIDRSQFAFMGQGVEMRLAVMRQYPLWVQNLAVSAQWFVQADPAQAVRLRNRIISASNHLYSFTDGQFALGDVVVRQVYDGWSAADIQLFANNTLQPKAIIGGIVAADTADFAPAVPITYTPGSVSIGSYWNRFGSPPNSVNVFEGIAYNEVAVADDWSLALAHEFGHFLLYLFDTYTGVDGVADIALTKVCTGTAMGDVYLPGNQNFVFDPTHWNTDCAGTEAHARLKGRTEWQTIAGWYPWVIVPESALAGPAAPPAPLTTVLFVSPQAAPGPSAAQVYNLDYRDGESSSGEARAFLFQHNRIVEQGKPPKASTTVQVTGAELGDRLCVYDVNDHAGAGESPRNQFSCETLAAGDDTLYMTKQPTWHPEVSIHQVGPQQVQVVVTSTLPGPAGAQMQVRLYPEHQTALAPKVLPRTGNVFSETFALTQPVTALYAQIFVNEAPALPLTRREVVADRGTGGGGAFGPAKAYGGVLVVSSDGNASFEGDQDVELQPGQSIAWQSMPGTPPLPFFKWISGQAYRLDAFPPALVEHGTIHIKYQDHFGVQAAGGAVGPEAIYFWNGAVWTPLSSTLATPAGATDGTRVASAPSAGNGVYAVLRDAPPGSATFLPLVRAGLR